VVEDLKAEFGGEGEEGWWHCGGGARGLWRRWLEEG
jgi:hypothetical protein